MGYSCLSADNTAPPLVPAMNLDTDNQPRGDCLERVYAYRMPWWELLGRFPIGAVLLLGLPWYFFLLLWQTDSRSPGEKAVVFAIAGASAVVIVLLARRTLRLVGRWRRGFPPIRIDGSLLEAPQQPPSSKTIRVPLGEITCLRLVRYWSESILHVDHGNCELCIPARALAGQRELDDFVDTLSRATGLSVHRYTQRFGRFSLRAMFLVTTAVAMVLALNRSLELGGETDGLIFWRGLLLLAAMSPMAVLLWTLPRPGRPTACHWFGIAYTVGIALELYGGFHVLRYVTGPHALPSDTRYMIYPLTFLITRLASWFVPRGYILPPEYFLSTASVVSGLLLGLVALLVWRAACRWYDRRPAGKRMRPAGTALGGRGARPARA